MFDTVISGAQVLLPTGVARRDVAISGRAIASIHEPGRQDEMGNAFDMDGMY